MQGLLGFTACVKMSWWSSLVVQQVKDVALPPLWNGFNPWPKNFHMLQVWQKRKKKKKKEVPVVAQQVKNTASIHEDAGLIPGLA